jgi:RimJ/RimL family protein N-acetyltransferase
VAAVTEWLLGLPEVRLLCARTLTGNVPGRRLLEKAGFQFAGAGGEEAVAPARAAPAS